MRLIATARPVSGPIGTLLVLCACLVFAGCGDGLSGEYPAYGGGMPLGSMEFKSGNRVTVSGWGVSRDGTYTVSGDTVTVTVDNKQTEFVIHKGGGGKGRGLVEKRGMEGLR